MAVDLLKQDNLRLNLGCGKDHKKGFINCDIQKIRGVDLVMDCADLSRFRDNSVSLIFGHSFFEHLYCYQQVPFLKDCRRILNEKGVLILLGIPDFTATARLYLEQAKAGPPFGGTFDLYQAYRQTHGDFEAKAIAVIPQFHKSLFDRENLTKLFKLVGFSNARIFYYTFPGEIHHLSIGVVAPKSDILDRSEIKKALSEFKSYFESLEMEEWGI